MIFTKVDIESALSAQRMFRYEDTTVGFVDGGTRTEIVLREYAVIRETPKGKWVRLLIFNQLISYPRFVLNKARKRYALETPEVARQAFIARKNRQIRILEAQLRQARDALNIVENITKVSPIREGRLEVER